MFRFFQGALTSKILVGFGVSTAVIAGITGIFSSSKGLAASDQAAPTQNQSVAFPDIQDHWARPFIEALAARNIIAGYLDGTFRPENPVARDEFAAMIRQAFNQAPERQIESGSVYQDVPTGYWAAPAIREAYEMGFMTGYPDGTFRPNDSISRVEAIATLASNLNLAASAPDTAAQPAAPDSAQVTLPARSSRRQARKPFPFPLAMTYFMAPVVASPVRVKPPTLATPTPAPSSEAAADLQPKPTQSPTALTISDYYVDADQIPQPATENVLAATKAGVVVNHPDPQVLNPNRPATRGEVAALIHQALVTQGRLEPLPDLATATNYIVQGR